jgi:L-2-hydroxyglutarate oxidase
MVEFCREADIAHEVCGKLVVACDDAELARLRKLEERGRQNGLEGIEFLGREAMLEREPNVGGIAALRVPQEGIVDYPGVCSELKRRITANGGDVQTGARVTRLEQRGDEWIATTPKGEFAGRYLVNCAGLHCDRVAGLAGEKRETRIVPFRGEYYKLVEGSEGLVRHLIYPVPDPQFPFLGVHFTRLIHGGTEAGPNAVLAFAREGYRKTDVNVRDLLDALTYSGLWRFVAKYPRMTALELWQSLSKRRFCKALQKLVPSIRVTDIEPGGAGVRAQAMAREGDLIQDFSLIQRPAALHVLNAPSPAATASLAIGEEIVRKILAGN